MDKRSEVKGVTWNTKLGKWQVRTYVFKKEVFLGLFNNEEDAINKLKDFKSKSKLRNKEELELIKYYINELYNVDISDISRQQPLPQLRALYCKIAFNVVTNVTYQEVGSVVNRDHTTILFSRKKLVPEINNNISYMEVYVNYPKVSDVNTFNEIQNINKLKDEYRSLFYKNIKLQKEISKYKGTTKLTPNELKYRMLPENEKIIYNERVDPILRMMPSRQKRKEVDKYETINCSQ